MVGIIIGIVAVIGLVAVTITFLIKGKEAKAKIDETLKEINDVLRDLRNKKIYYVEKTEFNVLYQINIFFYRIYLIDLFFYVINS